MDGVDSSAEPELLINRDALQLGYSFRKAETKLEQQVAGIWCDALRLDKVGLDDDFFDLGGDSLSAAEIVTAASAAFGLNVPPSRLMTLSTVAEFSEFVCNHKFALVVDLPAHISVASEGGAGAPVFIIHGQFGIMFPNPELLDSLRGRHPVYYINGIGFYDDTQTPRTLEGTAQAYLESVRHVAPMDGYHLVGTCSGSGVAHEMGRQADAADNPALSVTLIDPPFERMTGLRRSSARRDKWRRILHVSRLRLN